MAGDIAAQQAATPHLRLFQQAQLLKRQGRPVEAEALCAELLRTNPGHHDAWHLRGLLALERGGTEEGIKWIEESLRLRPEQPAAWSNLGNAWLSCGKPLEALECLQRALSLKPAYPAALYNQGNAQLAAGRLAEALASYEQVLRLDGQHVRAQSNRGLTLLKLGRREESRTAFARALELDPGFLDARRNLAACLLELGRCEEALASYEQLLQAGPQEVQALSGRGNALWRLGRMQEALASLSRALELDPRCLDALIHRGIVLQSLERQAHALQDYERALELAPGSLVALNNSGNALLALGEAACALERYDRAQALSCDSPDTLYNRAAALRELQRDAEAADCYAHLLRLSPGHEAALGQLFHLRMDSASWADYDSLTSQLRASLEHTKRITSPLSLLLLGDLGALPLICTRAYMQERYPQDLSLGPLVARGTPERLRVAYVSADFREHPVSYLLAGVLEHHDRQRLEVIGVCLAEADVSAQGARVRAAFDRCIDVKGRSDLEIAGLLRELEVDVAVDLMGLTEGARPGVFARRAAPVQVSYLGYPGTLGAPYIDYLIADSVVVPEGEEGHYSEGVVRLPGCFLPHDDRRELAPAPARAAAGLPPEARVLCAFTSPHKINPPMFDVWMRLLREIPGSVLWLNATEPPARANLEREAMRRGVDAARLVFAPHVSSMAEHLARQSLADLYLDTLPYNSHSTACDALWAGVPVITCAGRSLASRVAASALSAVGLPELITHSLIEYEARALELLRSPGGLKELRSRLEAQRTSAPLFNTAVYTHHLESAYRAMYQRSAEAAGVSRLRDHTSSARASLASSASSLEARLQRALELERAGELERAEAAYQEILGQEPGQPQALHRIALIALSRAPLARGIELLKRSVQGDPSQLVVLVHLARASLQAGQAAEAIAACERALALAPELPEALQVRGDAYLLLKQPQAALDDYDRALCHWPEQAALWCNRGLALQNLQRVLQALESYDRALALAPSAAAYHNRGNVLGTMLRFEEAQASYEAALRLEPSLASGHFLFGSLLHARAQCCDWREEAALRAEIIQGVQQGRLVSHPWVFLTAFDSPALQRQCAEAFARVELSVTEEPPWRGRYYRHDRIRVAYLSADFHQHATAVLAAGLFAAHDARRIETIAVSFGHDDASPLRQRLEGSFERFLDAHTLSDQQVQRQLRALEIDIAVDLKGYTANHQARLLARRVAPIQVSYLGYPGTLGLATIDYLLADRTVVPPEDQAHYSEQVIYLPGCYQVNDSRRALPAAAPTRAEAGLPGQGFVFASFNAQYKITAVMFDVWMRLLERVPGSVLWLLADNPAAVGNLRREAVARGIDPARLIFAPRLAPHAHLARQCAADLMLDTLPCNAHTSCSDALWAGLPVLTCQGASFAGRVAASLLKAAGAPELVTYTLKEYEERAIELATQPARLAELRARLVEGRARAPLFDTPRFARHLEVAYAMMMERHRQGLPPQGFAVPQGASAP
jgi:predicted O-linked N-acetylglucosamine transferase (SPINDLY family)